jgi:DNA invertase Pin-like site-specific DNA recombinase
MKNARVYLRVSTAEQDIERQRALVGKARDEGYYIAGIYEDKMSGTSADRPALNRMIADLQPGDVVIAEKMDRISRAPIKEATAIIDAIRGKGAKLVVPGIVDLSDIQADGMARIILDAVQEMLLKVAMQMARDDWETRAVRQAQGIAEGKKAGKYKGRPVDTLLHAKVRALLTNKALSVKRVSELAGCSPTTVAKIRDNQ